MVWTLADCALRTSARNKGAARLLICTDRRSSSVSCKAVTSVIFPPVTLIWPWTEPKRVWTTSPAKVPPAFEEAPDEPVDPEAAAELPADPLELLLLDPAPDPAEPVVPVPAPVEPADAGPAVVPVALAVSATWVPDCQPASRIPAEARVAETTARILTSRTFRSGVALPARLPGVRHRGRSVPRRRARRRKRRRRPGGVRSSPAGSRTGLRRRAARSGHPWAAGR